MKKLLLTIAIVLLMNLGIVDTVQAVQIYGEPQLLGKGTVRTWIQFDDYGHPLNIGVSFTKAALFGLPTEFDRSKHYPLKLMLIDGSGHSTFEYELTFPKKVAIVPFTHVGFNWSPQGHTPEGIFSLPHFDIHFYMMNPEERYAIKATDDNFLEKSYKIPPEEFVAEGYFPAPMSAEPRMGVHWVDATSPEFQGESFTKAIIYGFYEGKIAFLEPMITLDFLLHKPNITTPIKQPAKYPQDGYYPTAYSINYDASSEEYTVSLDGLTFRAAASAFLP